MNAPVLNAVRKISLRFAYWLNRPGKANDLFAGHLSGLWITKDKLNRHQFQRLDT